jgi:multidrug efflux pump subunit AcrA (membrane-fusion protein)
MKRSHSLMMLVIIVVMTGCGPGRSTAVHASGQVQAKEVAVAVEISGRVEEVMVSEGDAVREGDPLFWLEDTLLQAEREAAAAEAAAARAGVQTAQNALDTAKAEYQRTLEGALARDQESRLQDWFTKDPKQFDQPGWYFSRLEQTEGAQSQVELAAKQVDEAQSRLDMVINSAAGEEMHAAEQRLLGARLAYLITREVKTRAGNSTTADEPVGRSNLANCGKNEGYVVNPPQLTNVLYPCEGNVQLKSAGSAMYDEAQAELAEAQAAYDNILNTKAAADVLQARADVAVAQERYYTALDLFRNLQTGDQAPEVRAAKGAVDQGEAN